MVDQERRKNLFLEMAKSLGNDVEIISSNDSKITLAYLNGLDDGNCNSFIRKGNIIATAYQLDKHGKIMFRITIKVKPKKKG